MSRTIPEKNVVIDTVAALDEFFISALVGDDGVCVQRDRIVLCTAHCYVTLKFVQQFFLQHMRDTEREWTYYFSPVINIPGVYTVKVGQQAS